MRANWSWQSAKLPSAAAIDQAHRKGDVTSAELPEDRGSEVIVTVSIDTEEDNWHAVRSGLSVENIRELPQLDAFLDELGIRVTYFTTYQVLARPWAVDILREIHSNSHAQIGAHLHPWNTPPLDQAFIPDHTMLKNLPLHLQRAKLKTLTEAFCNAFGSAPMVFRAGRFGLGPETVSALIDCGYRVDSSVTPYISWEAFDHGPTFVGAPCTVYRLHGDADVRVPQADGPLVEVPISCGYNRRPFSFWGSLHRFLSRREVRLFRLAGIASRTGLLRRIVLSPETDSTADMLTLSRHLIETGVRYLHLFWHSPSLRPGLTPFTRTQADVDRLYATVADYLEGVAGMARIRFATVTEAAEELAPAQQLDAAAQLGATSV